MICMCQFVLSLKFVMKTLLAAPEHQGHVLRYVHVSIQDCILTHISLSGCGHPLPAVIQLTHPLPHLHYIL